MCYVFPVWSTDRFMAVLWVFTHYTLHTLLHFKRWSAPGLWKLLHGSWWKKLFSEHLFQKQKQVCDSHLLGTGTSLFYADSQGNSPRESTQGSFKTFLSFIKQMAKLSMLGHFRIALSLRFKARLNECEAIAMKTTFYSRANKTHFHLKDFPLSFVSKERDLELENDLLFIAVSHPEP